MAAKNSDISAASQEKGVVSVSGASTLEELTQALARKAAAAGASDYRITSAGGKNKLYGTAVIY
nr:YdgH/BhsA/McbA-like domain containing protein [Pantoea cypripedii]